MNADLDLLYTPSAFRMHGFHTAAGMAKCPTVAEARASLQESIEYWHREAASYWAEFSNYSIVRDCSRAIRGMCGDRAIELSGFDMVAALYDLASGNDSMSLAPAFIAEMTHLLLGLENPSQVDIEAGDPAITGLSGRNAAIARTAKLDKLWSRVEDCMKRYGGGLDPGTTRERAEQRATVQELLGASDRNWDDWRWQMRHLLKDPEVVSSCFDLTPSEAAGLEKAKEFGVPFAATPYYASLISRDPKHRLDASLRAQILPPESYVHAVSDARRNNPGSLDFMLERDTSPVDLVTRRYPAIAILKPFNMCPQICVYCQRNWEVEETTPANAAIDVYEIEEACRWIGAHPAIREVLVTGGEPLALDDRMLETILLKLAGNPRIEMIRIGTRALVTMPMRITDRLVDILGSLREPGRRAVCVVTHIQHAREVTPELVEAAERLRKAGISIYNQMVFTFFNSRRFEASALRMLLGRCGIDPYYTFVPKGKEETMAYRVPMARILQEQREEARLLPGTRRTDATVFNIPGLGKNYLLDFQNRDLLSVRPDGSRVYEFHPWEKNISRQSSYVGRDIPILDYLNRLIGIGEDPSDYGSIWYYF